MKKLFLGASLLATVAVSAQDFSSTRFGVTAGLNYSGVSNAHNPSGKKIGPYAGLMAIVPVDNNNQFFIQPEVEYFSAGETGDKSYESAKNLSHAVYAINFLAVPVFFKGYFSEAESEFFGMLGPQFNFVMSEKVTNPSKAYYTTDTFGKAKGFNFGLAAGVGYSYKRKLELTLRYNLGLSDTYPDLKNSPDNSLDAALTKKKSSQVVSAGLTYIFD